MGRPDVREMTLVVTFDRDGNATSVRYWDQEGCGHESKEFSLAEPVAKLASYHLGHLAKSHKVLPTIYCGQPLVHEGVEIPGLRCTLEVHDAHVKHRYES